MQLICATRLLPLLPLLPVSDLPCSLSWAARLGRGKLSAHHVHSLVPLEGGYKMSFRCLIHCDSSPPTRRAVRESATGFARRKAAKKSKVPIPAPPVRASLRDIGPSLAPRAACGCQRGIMSATLLRTTSHHRLPHAFPPVGATLTGRPHRRGRGPTVFCWPREPRVRSTSRRLSSSGYTTNPVVAWPWHLHLLRLLLAATAKPSQKGGREAGNAHGSAHSRGRKRRPQAGPSAPGRAKPSAASVSG